MQAEKYLVIVASLFAIAAGSAFGQDESKRDDRKKELRDRVRSRIVERFDEDKNGRIDDAERKAAKEKMKESAHRRRDAAGRGEGRPGRGEGRRMRRGMHPDEREMRMRRIERFRHMRNDRFEPRRERADQIRERFEGMRRDGEGRRTGRPTPIIERRLEHRLPRRDANDTPGDGKAAPRRAEGRPMIEELRKKGPPHRPLLRARIIDRYGERN